MPKTFIFRACGLLPPTTEEDLKDVLSKNLGAELNFCNVDFVIQQTPIGESITAIFGVEDPIPEALKQLVNKHSHARPLTLKYRGEVVTVDANFDGFTQLYSTTGEHIRADIIAITGINGHAYGSWVSRDEVESMWLRDFFRRDFPDCRVMTYGYNANLRSKGLHTMIDFTQQFLSKIKHIRGEAERHRPLFFICHSYGGLVVTHSLVEANLKHADDYYKDFVISTYAIFFFGTPHRGMAVKNLQDAVEAIGGNKERKDLLQSIDKHCETLKNELRRFVNLCNNIHICTFTETIQTAEVIVDNGDWIQSLDGFLITAVAQDSALLQLPDTIEKKFTAEGDHSTMVKINSRQNGTYIDIYKALSDLLGNAVKDIPERFLTAIPESKFYTIGSNIATESVKFTGRKKEISELEKALTGASSRKKTVVLHGMGGIGKTSIATEFARYHAHYAAKFWIDCTSVQTTTTSIINIGQKLLEHYIDLSSEGDAIRRLGLTGFVTGNQIKFEDDSRKQFFSSVLKWFQLPENRDWLLILDNADDMKAFDDQLLLPECNHGAILVTSRIREMGSSVGEIIFVKEMLEDDSIKLFRRHSQVEPKDESSINAELNIIHALGNLPLALEQAGAYIAMMGTTLQTYLSIYHESFSEIWNEPPSLKPTPERNYKTVKSTWLISFKAIKETMAWNLFTICTFFSHDNVSKDFFQDCMRKEDLDNAIRTLHNYALIGIKASGSVFTIHALVHRSAFEYLRSDIDTLQRSVKGAAEVVDKSVRKIYSLRSGEARAAEIRYTNLVTHISVLSKKLSKLDEQIDEADIDLVDVGVICRLMGLYKPSEQLLEYMERRYQRSLGHDHPSTLESMASLATTYRNQGCWNEARELEVRVMETKKRVLGVEHPSTVASMANLASTYRSQGLWKEAEELEVQVFEMSLRVLGEEHPSTLTIMANLASTYTNQGRWQEAEELEVRVLEMRKRVLNEEHPEILTITSNLASTYANQGRWKEAEELEVWVMETRKTVLGEEHPDALTSMANLALTYENRGRWKEAEELEVQVLEIRKRVLSEEHPSTLTSMANLAAMYTNQGRWKEAEELEVQVMETRKTVLGEENPSTLTSMANLASTYRGQGRWKEAEELEIRVMEVRKKILGEEHPDTLTITSNLASTYRNQGRWKKAEELEVRVMETRKTVLGEEHPSILDSMVNLASTYRDQERWKEAEELEMQVMEVRKRVLGEDHPDTLTSMNNLAFTFWNRERWKEAEELFLLVVETSLRVLGEEHRSTLTSMANLASTYENRRRWKEAEELLVRINEARMRVLGEEHTDTLASMNGLASTYWNQGRWKEAEELEVRVMETRKRVLGEKHPDALTSMANLASTYRNLGRWKEAEELEVRVMETRKTVLGEEHPSTLISMSSLASTYRDQRRWKEAEELEVQVMEIRKRVHGGEHPSTLTSMANLASMYTNQGRWKEAEELEVRIIETRERVLGEEHSDTLDSMANLALTYKNQERWKETEELEIRVLEARKRVLGEEHTDTLTSMNGLALTYWNQGCRKEAEKLFVRIMETSLRVLGKEHPSTLTSMANLASTYKNQRRWKEAEVLEERVMKMRKRVLGEEHPSTLTSMANLALTYWNRGRRREAEELEMRVMEVRKRVLDEEHPDALNSMANLALMYENWGRWKEA